MLPDNATPPYLPHLRQPGVLAMGLAPLGERPWIETDTQLPRYHAHKLRQRRALGERVYRALPTSRDAQLELSALQIHSAETGVPEGSKGSADGGTRRSQRLYINESA